MATRVHHAPRRTPTTPRAASHGLPRPSQRAVLIVLGCVLAGALAYALARETSLFAAREVVVAGGSPSVRREVRGHLATLEGVSLVALDPAGLAEQLERLPAVRAAAVDRAFPHRLSVVIAEERPLAVLVAGKHAVLVSARGRAIRDVPPRSVPRLPRIPVGSLGGLDPGERVAVKNVAHALRALAHVPRRFPLRVVSAGATEEGISLTLEGELEVRLGDEDDLGAKVRAAGVVLRSLSAEERATLVYVDATLPNRVVASDNPQVEG